MGTTLNPKTGLSPSVWGAGVGLLLLLFANFFGSVAKGGDLQLIPVIDFGSNPLGFIGGFFGFFFTTIPGLVVLIVTIVAYIVGTFSVQGTTGDEPDLTAVFRGILIGLCGGMNFVLAYRIYTSWFGSDAAGIAIGLVILVLGVIGAFSEVSQSGAYQGIIGWLSWAAPMSWPTFFVGLIFLVLSLIGALIGLAGVNFFKIGGDASANPAVAGKYFDANWRSGTFFLIGGLAGNANYGGTAFDMGSWAFIHRTTTGDHREHESGHNLSLFVFGWIVHYIGALDENLPVIGHGSGAFTERIAESHDPSGSSDKLEVWS